MSKDIANKSEDSAVMFNAREAVGTLNNLMNKVTEKDINAETVNAACNCAARITDLLRVHLEYQRMKIRASAR